jgi:nicotinate-nucleotide adenylyltransferase
VNKAKRVAIFGGTFNPPHIGHFLIAKKIQKLYNLDKIIFVPAYIPPHKQEAALVDAAHRGEMVKLLIQGENDFIYSDYEIKKHNVSYSIDTVKYFMTEFPDKEFFFITGSDAFYGIDKWKESARLLELVKFVVYLRKDFPRQKVAEKFPHAAIEWADPAELINLSSSNIREKLKKGDNCRGDLGEKVWEYIKKNGLYK